MQEGIATTALCSKTPFAALAQVGTRDAQIPALLQSRSTAFNSWQLFARAERSLLCCTMERTALSCAKTRIPNTVTLLHPAQLRGADLTLLGVGNVGFGAEKERSPKPNPTLPMRRSTLSFPNPSALFSLGKFCSSCCGAADVLCSKCGPVVCRFCCWDSGNSSKEQRWALTHLCDEEERLQGSSRMGWGHVWPSQPPCRTWGHASAPRLQCWIQGWRCISGRRSQSPTQPQPRTADASLHAELTPQIHLRCFLEESFAAAAAERR